MEKIFGTDDIIINSFEFLYNYVHVCNGEDLKVCPTKSSSRARSRAKSLC